MRQGCVLLMGLFFGGCILEGPTTSWLGRPRVFQGPSGSDVIQLDVAVLEGPVGNRAFNHDLWRVTDEQGIAPETQTVLEENGLRVGQIGGIAPQELQTLLTSERSCVRSRRIQLRSGTPHKLVLGPALSKGHFVLHDKGRDTGVNLDQADAGGVVFAMHDRGPVALDQRGENGGLTIVAGSKARRLNRCLLRIFPIIVRIEKISIAIVQFHLWIL